MIVLTILTISSTWFFSRFVAPRDAWRSAPIDFLSAMVGVAAWIANTFEILTTPNLASELDMSALVIFANALFTIAVYVGLILAFVHLRVWLYNRNQSEKEVWQ